MLKMALFGQFLIFFFEKMKNSKKQKTVFITHRVGHVVEFLGLYLSWFGLGESQMIQDDT